VAVTAAPALVGVGGEKQSHNNTLNMPEKDPCAIVITPQAISLFDFSCFKNTFLFKQYIS